MCICPYDLPSFAFVGGSSKSVSIDLYDGDGNPFVVDVGATVLFTMVSYLNDSEDPVVVLSSGGGQITVSNGDEGSRNRVTVSLDPSDTFDLWGRYVYQLAITDAHSNTEVLGQGAIVIFRNFASSRA